MNELTGLLLSPVRTMQRRCEGDVRLALPFAIFTGALLLFIIDMLVMYRKIVATLPGGANLSMANLGFSLNLAFFGINMFLFWIAGSGILACLAILLDGGGEYRRVLELTGLAHLPSLIFAVVGLAIAVGYQPTLRLDGLLSRDLSRATAAEHQEFEAELRAEVAKEAAGKSFVAIHTCRYAFALWTLALCVLAVKLGFKLDYLKSAMSVAGLVLLYVALEVVRGRMMADKLGG